MAKTIGLQFIKPIIIFFILYVLFYFSGFLLGYGANNKHINQEISLFIYFGIAHLIITFIYFLKEQKFSRKYLFLIVTEVSILWIIAAWNNGYFSL